MLGEEGPRREEPPATGPGSGTDRKREHRSYTGGGLSRVTRLWGTEKGRFELATRLERSPRRGNTDRLAMCTEFFLRLCRLWSSARSLASGAVGNFIGRLADPFPCLRFLPAPFPPADPRRRLCLIDGTRLRWKAARGAVSLSMFSATCNMLLRRTPRPRSGLDTQQPPRPICCISMRRAQESLRSDEQGPGGGGKVASDAFARPRCRFPVERMRLATFLTGRSATRQRKAVK